MLHGDNNEDLLAYHEEQLVGAQHVQPGYVLSFALSRLRIHSSIWLRLASGAGKPRELMNRTLRILPYTATLNGCVDTSFGTRRLLATRSTALSHAPWSGRCSGSSFVSSRTKSEASDGALCTLYLTRA